MNEFINENEIRRNFMVIADLIIFSVVGYILVMLFGGIVGAIAQAKQRRDSYKELAVMSLNDLEELLVNVRQERVKVKLANPKLKWEQSRELMDLRLKEFKIMEFIRKHDDPHRQEILNLAEEWAKAIVQMMLMRLVIL